MAPDAVECCSLARRLAFRLTDGMAADTISTSGKTAEFRCLTTAGVGGGAGESDFQRLRGNMHLTFPLVDSSVPPLAALFRDQTHRRVQRSLSPTWNFVCATYILAS